MTRDSDRSGEAIETAKTGSTVGTSAGPKDIAHNQVGNDAGAVGLVERPSAYLWCYVRRKGPDKHWHVRQTPIEPCEGNDTWAGIDVVPLYTQAEIARLTNPAEPIPMLLFCPECHLQHIDEPDERTPEWDNPPHRSHLCHGCGTIWRPADVPTNGVAAIETQGKADTWTLAMTKGGGK